MQPHSKPLPAPSSELLQQSQCLVEAITNKIHQTGPLAFEAYMAMALYDPDNGYYQNQQPFGQAGDFITAAHCGPWFSHMLAKQIIQVSNQITHYAICEFGAGDGTMALNILLYLEEHHTLPECYTIIEKSHRLQKKQRERFKGHPQLLSKLKWAEEIPTHFSGFIFANELLDAMPFHRFKKVSDHQYDECFITIKQGQLTETWQPTKQSLPSWAHELDLENGHIFEINPHLESLLKEIYSQSKQAILLLIDYGAEERAYFSRSKTGYARAFYKHRVHDNLLLWPGLQDLTTHVNFTAVAQAAYDLGWSIEGYTSQANFMMDCGISEVDLPAYDSQEGILARAQIKQLMLPQDMGETFKLLALSKDCDMDLVGFQNEMSHKL
jgi:SAM-dependent MidA family methyltransferase